MKLIVLFSALIILNSCADKSLQCEDLLMRYGEKIQKIEFIDCEKGKGQTILQAKYKVVGIDSEEIEQILIKKYGIGKLKFTCCGWESTNGKNGYLKNDKLLKINPNYRIEISMYGSAEKKNQKGETCLELDRNKVEFYVEVKLLDV